MRKPVNSNQYFQFPEVPREVFDKNYLDQVIVEIRYPTYLHLKETAIPEISDKLRKDFPRYEAGETRQVTPAGVTEPEAVFSFSNRQNNFKIEVTSSRVVLSTHDYQSFENFLNNFKYVLDNCIPSLKAPFFTRIGLRFINNIKDISADGNDLADWINSDLVRPIGTEIGSVFTMKNEITGPLECGGRYGFRYGLAPPEVKSRHFILDYDYFNEDVEADACIDLLDDYHKLHFPFFWWSLGEKAKEALRSGVANS